MPTPLNPLIVARLRKYWLNNEKDVDRLLYKLEDWVYIFGPGPGAPICDSCWRGLSFVWSLCKFCSDGTPICWECYQCSKCEDIERGDVCCECGRTCGAYMCKDCKND